MLAAILTGRTPHLYPHKGKLGAAHPRQGNRLATRGPPPRSGDNAARVRRVTYTAQVWCPTLANRTFLARRDGTVYFTGKSYRDAVGELRYAGTSGQLHRPDAAVPRLLFTRRRVR